MARSKDAWLKEGAGDLKEVVVEDVPVAGQSVLVRALPATYSNDAQFTATELKIVGRDQIVAINKDKLERVMWKHGVIDPVFDDAEIEYIATHFGPSWNKVIEKINEISGIDAEAIEDANARFQARGTDAPGADLADANGAGDADEVVPARVGAGAGDAGGGDVPADVSA